MDAQTPCVLLGDDVPLGVSAIVLLSDDDRRTLAWVVEQAEMRRELMLTRHERRRLSDRWLTRLGVLLAGSVALTDLWANIHHIFGSGP